MIYAPRAKDWEYIDSHGRKIGFMWPEDFGAALDYCWGYQKGIKGFAEYCGFNYETIRRYAAGDSPIPRHVAILAQSLVSLIPRSQTWDRTAEVALNPETRMKNFPKLDPYWLSDDQYQRPRTTVEVAGLDGDPEGIQIGVRATKKMMDGTLPESK